MRACNRCGASIGFRKDHGKWRPTDPSGQWHECRAASVPRSLPGIPITGADYAPVDCRCVVAPWEHCPCFPELAYTEPRLSVLMGEALAE